MPLYLGTDDSGTTGSSLQDFAPTGWQKMSAAVRESWLESYGPSVTDYLRGVNSDDKRKITAAEAESMRMGIGGGARVSIKPKDNEYTAGQWTTILERQRELAAVKDVRDRTPWELGSVLRGTAMFGAGIVDPINLATAFVPWTKTVSALNSVRAAAMSESFLARTGARAILGGADAGISTAVLEPLNYSIRQAIGDDYTAMDSLANIAFGTAFGGGLHVIGGGVGDVFRGRFRRAADAAAVADSAPTAGQITETLRLEDTAAAPMMDAPRITPEAERVGMPEVRNAPETKIEFVPEKVQQAADAEVARLRGEVADAARVADTPAARVADSAPTAAPSAPAARPGPRNDLLAALKKAGGVSPDLAREATGENGMRLNRALPGLVRREGGLVQYDQAAQLLADEGFLTPGIDPLSYEAAAEAEDLISRALNGERIVRWETRMQEDLAALNALEPASAADVAASLSPETREAALRAAVAQALDGRAVDVEPIVGMDESLQMNTIDDVAAAVDRGYQPESQPLADFEASKAVDERNATAPKWDLLEAADQALIEADALLADTVKAADEAWRYSRQQAFHGSPHRGIKQFSTDKIGTGEGAQAYGWGLYFASKKEIAEFYRHNLTRTTGWSEADANEIADAFATKYPDAMRAEGVSRADLTHADYNMLTRLVDDWADAEFKKFVNSKTNNGQLYKVEIPEDSDMLLWDKPLSEQPEGVRKALEKHFGFALPTSDEIKGMKFLRAPAREAVQTGQAFYKMLATQMSGRPRVDTLTREQLNAWYEREVGYRPDDDNGSPLPIDELRDLVRGFDAEIVSASDAPRAASEALAALGIKGIKYLDGTSRGAGDGSFNYVVFSGDDVSITDTYYSRGITGQSAADELTGAIRASFGDATDALLEAGRVKIVATVADIPDGPHPADVKGATAPDGTVYMVAENMSPAEARGMMLHEVGVHVGMEAMVGPDVFRELKIQFDDALIAGEAWAQKARAAVPVDTPANLVHEEQLAYLVQNAPELPIVQRIIAAVRAWAYRTFQFARDRMTLTEADFRAMAVAALHHAARSRDAAASGGTSFGRFGRDVAQTETKAFRDWFGESKVVGADGEPLVVYHGTRGDFTEFSLGKAGSQTDSGWLGRGFYFGEAAVASGYAGADEFNGRVADGATVMPVYLSLKKPAILKDTERNDGPRTMVRELLDLGDEATSDEVRAGLLSAGYDGVIYERWSPSGGGYREYVAFDAKQIKSATGNRGTFDPKNPDIRYSRGETQDPSTARDELKPYDEAVARAKDYAKVLRAAADKLANDADAVAAMRAALPDISKAEIDSLLGQLRKEVKGLRGITRASREALTAEDRAAIMQPDAMRAADTLANNLQMAAIIERRNAALNQNVRLKASSFLNQFRKPELDFEGFRALLVGSERKRDGARLSVEAEQKQFRGEWLGGTIADMEKAGVWKAFESGAFDRDVYVALHAIGKGEQPTGIAPEAVKIAEIVHKYQEDARNTRNRFGAWIRDLSGYITRQTHDMFKIRDAGQAEWVKTVLPLLDIPKMQRLGLISETDPVRSLQDLYSDFASGRHMKAVAGEDDMAAFGAGRNLAKRESASRALYFKDGDAAFQYNTKFGQGRLTETVLQGLDGAAKSAGLLKVLGTNPEATLDRLFMEYEDSLRGDPDRRAKFAQKKGELKNLLATLDGTTNIPGSVQAAKIAAFSRSWMAMAKLGGMLISAVTDLSNYAAEMRFGQDKNLLGGVLDGMGSLTRGRAKGEQKQILASLGVFHESMLGGAYHRFDNPDLMGGKMAAAMQTFFKWTGINWWTETLRDAYALSHSHYMASNSGKSFDALPEALRDMLGLYKIDAGKWELLRNAPLQAADGRTYMTPEGVNTLPRQALENYIASVGRTVSDASVQNLRDDLASALRAMTIDRMHHAVIEPGARTRAFMQRGTQPGTVPGEFLRYIGQFKSFPVALIQMTLGREVYGRGYDTIGEYLRKGKGEMLGLASFLALSVGMGYAAMSIKDLLKGKNPRPVDDYRTWMAAFVQGGGLGIYGDFLFGQYSRTGSTLTASLAGPVFGAVDTLADLKTRLQKGDDVAAAAFKAALDNTPFMNVFYTRIALDYLFLYQIQEALNPGFLRRMEQRVRRDNGQTYWLPPSEAAR